MHYIVYTSRTTRPFPEVDLERFLERWRLKNARLDITGVLLYSEGEIMQVLEGSADAVQDLFTTIAADLRHRDVVKLGDGPLQARAFADWSMRFRVVEPADFECCLQQLNAASSHANTLAPLLEAFMASAAW